MSLDLSWLPDATMVEDHKRGDRSGRGPGPEKIFMDKCIGFLRSLWGLPTCETLGPPSQGVIEGAAQDRGDTPNQRALATLWAFVAFRGQNGTRDALLAFFRKQRCAVGYSKQGQQWGEQCSSSHGQLWKGWGAMAYAIALELGDQEVLEEASYWLAVEAALADALTDHDGHVTSPNGRSAGSTFDLGTVWGHYLRGTQWPESSLILGRRGQVRPLVAPPRDDYRGFWSDPYNMGVCVLRVLKERGDGLGGVFSGRREEPRLRGAMRVLRNGKRYVKVVDRVESSEFLFWTAWLEEEPEVKHVPGPGPNRWDAPHKSGRFPQGLDNPFPPPELEAETTIIIRGLS